MQFLEQTLGRTTVRGPCRFRQLRCGTGLFYSFAVLLTAVMVDYTAADTRSIRPHQMIAALPLLREGIPPEIRYASYREEDNQYKPYGMHNVRVELYWNFYSNPHTGRGYGVGSRSTPNSDFSGPPGTNTSLSRRLVRLSRAVRSRATFSTSPWSG